MVSCTIVLMHYIVALGNPGEEYADTRHNIAWHIAEHVTEKYHLTTPQYQAKCLGRVSEGTIGEAPIVLLYPDTFMNHSGGAVKKLVPAQAYGHIIVIHDEIALPFGEIKVSVGRGDGGHNGIKSIISSLNTKDFIRIRVGIAPTSFFTGTMKVISGEARARFVLGRLTKRELDKLPVVGDAVAEALRLIVERGSAMAMNRFNS
jgi:peptidyl-tRNA hydrolase, PTH1 family